MTAGTALQFPVSGFTGSTSLSQWLDPVNENFCTSSFPYSHPGDSAPSTCTALHTALPLDLQKYVFLRMSLGILERVDDGKMTASRTWEPFRSVPLPSYCCDPKPPHYWPVGQGKQKKGFGKDFKHHPVPTPLLWAGTSSTKPGVGIFSLALSLYVYY